MQTISLPRGDREVVSGRPSTRVQQNKVGMKKEKNNTEENIATNKESVQQNSAISETQ